MVTVAGIDHTDDPGQGIPNSKAHPQYFRPDYTHVHLLPSYGRVQKKISLGSEEQNT